MQSENTVVLSTIIILHIRSLTTTPVCYSLEGLINASLAFIGGSFGGLSLAWDCLFGQPMQLSFVYAEGL